MGKPPLAQLHCALMLTANAIEWARSCERAYSACDMKLHCI